MRLSSWFSPLADCLTLSSFVEPIFTRFWERDGCLAKDFNPLKRRLPFDRHMLGTGWGLDQMAASGEGERWLRKVSFRCRSIALGSMPAARRLAPSMRADAAISGTGIDQNELQPGIDDQRRERGRQLVSRHERFRQGVLDLGERRVPDEFVGDRPIPDAIVERRDLKRADAITIDAGCLLAGRRPVACVALSVAQAEFREPKL